MSTNINDAPTEGMLTSEPSQCVTPELHFLAACSYVCADVEGRARQRQVLELALSTGITSEAIWAGIQRHRIFSTAEHVLSSHSMMPVLGLFQSACIERSGRNRLFCLKLSSESARITELLTANRIAFRWVKGPKLSQKLYRDACLRHSKDLDILVKPVDIGATAELLKTIGYEIAYGQMWLTSSSWRYVAQRTLRNIELVNPRLTTRLELHWRLEALPHDPFEQIWWKALDNPTEAISSGEILYLCLHGAVHRWSRLKWVGDIRSLLIQRPKVWAGLLSLSKELGLDLILAQAIRLQRLIYNDPLDDWATEITKRHPEADALAQAALLVIAKGDPGPYLTGRELVAFRRYSFALEKRFPVGCRLKRVLGLMLTNTDDLALWHSHPALMIALPVKRLSRVAKVLYRAAKSKK
jgi:hypothetical protein